MLTHRLGDAGLRRAPDELIVEEPLEIRLDDHLVTTTMRTPGHDFELAAGFLHAEGLLGGARVLRCRYCGTGSAVDTEFNVVSVETGHRAPPPTARLALTTSSCGLCGAASIEALRERLEPLRRREPFDLDVLAGIPERVAADQDLFETTGAVHSAAAVDRTGRPVVVREDVGRHNAVDKVVGHLLLGDALPAGGHALYASGRASFEIVQKAWAAGFSAVVSVSAPTSLAVDVARAAGLVLAGFVRDGHLNLYAPELPTRPPREDAASEHAGRTKEPAG